MTDSLFSAMFPAARAALRAVDVERLRQGAAGITDWHSLPAFAEAQRMAPLFYHHARAAGVELPVDVQLQLQGLAIRHRRINQARIKALAEILPACRSAGIDVALLKGAALFCLVYPQPGLRPMSDIDLLTRPAQSRRLEALLRTVGYQPIHEEAGKPRSTRHEAALCKTVDGFQITMEVHHHLFDPTWRAHPPPVDAWLDRARPFQINGIPAQTLALEDMLWHIYQHMINEEIRLVGIADLISTAEHFAAEVDWEKMHRIYPGVIQALSLFHSLCPLDDILVQHARISLCPTPSATGEDLQGWPRIALRQGRALGIRRFLSATFLPSEWWLRLYYGINSGRAVAVHRWLLHPLEVFRMALKHLALHLRPFSAAD